MDGVRYLFYPDLEKLYDAEVWSMAGSQVLFSYVSGQGVLTSLGSFNKFNFNVFKWSCMLCITNFLASMMAGVAIFSVLGNMAYEVGVNVRDVAQGGPGLAFIVYPRALSNLPMPTLWYILFFGMILLLGVSSQNAEVESMVTMLVDLKPRFFNANRRRRPLFVLFVCLTCFCCALIMTSQGGMYLFQLCDSYGASGISLLIIVLFENVAVGWIYGRKRFYEDMFFMFGHKMDPRKSIWPVLGYIWQFVTPVLISAVLGYAFTNWKSPTFERYDGVYEYPPMGVAIALLMTMSSAICIPVYFIYLFLKTKTRNITVLQTLKKMMVPIYPDDHPYHELNSSRESSCTDSRTDASSKILM